jgi:DNA-binding XRE family transcriptional regulator
VSDPKDYRIEIKVKNNRLLTKMEGAGYFSVAKLADTIGMNRHTIYRIVSMKSAALDEEGYYRPEALRIAEFLNCTPQDIYPPAQMRGTMKENKAQITANANEVDSLTSSLRTLAFSPERKMILEDAKQVLKAAMMTLTPKEQRILDFCPDRTKVFFAARAFSSHESLELLFLHSKLKFPLFVFEKNEDRCAMIKKF